jgi:hypothetical protein
MNAPDHSRQRQQRSLERLVPNPKLKFMEQCREVMRFHRLALRTEEAYLQWIKRFMVFHREKAEMLKAESRNGAAAQQHRTSNIEHRTSNIEHSTFNIQHSTFNIEHSTFNIQHSTFNIQHRTFNIQHRTFNIQHRTFNIQHRMRAAGAGGQAGDSRSSSPSGVGGGRRRWASRRCRRF